MTKDEASKTVTESGLHVGGAVGFKAVEYDCPGGYAVVAPVEGHADLWFALTEYHVNIFEEPQAIAAAPPIVRLSIS